jgi:hypothetical protein
LGFNRTRLAAPAVAALPTSSALDTSSHGLCLAGVPFRDRRLRAQTCVGGARLTLDTGIAESVDNDDDVVRVDGAKTAEPTTSGGVRPVARIASAAIALALQAGQPCKRIGPWRRERLLAEGGMGSVWLAQRADGVMQRSAARKLLRAEWVDRGLAKRIARERDILARLRHDAGIGVDDRLYLALEYVQGQAIDDWCRDRQTVYARRRSGVHDRRRPPIDYLNA